MDFTCNSAEMFSFGPNPTRAKKPGPLLLVYFMDLSFKFPLCRRGINYCPVIKTPVTGLKRTLEKTRVKPHRGPVGAWRSSMEDSGTSHVGLM